MSESNSPGKIAGIVVFVVFVILPALAIIAGFLLWLALTIWKEALSLL
jgi:hypothetical protein